MTQGAAGFALLPRWGQVACAVLAGAVGGLAFAPFYLSAAIVVPLLAGFVMLATAQTPRAAMRQGWALGFGYFGVTLTWIVEPFQVDAAATGWMAPFALVLLAILMGLFWGVALGLARCLGVGAVALPITWSAVEMLRAYLLTGFPWASPPQALVDGLAGQGLAWFGPHGVMLAMVAFGAVIARLMHAGFFGSSVRPARAAGAVAAGGMALALILAPPLTGPSALTSHTVRLVQPNAPQEDKWNADKIAIFVNRQIEYTAAQGTPDLIIWPETALPYLVENAQVVFDVIAEAARGAPVALGIQRRDGDDYFNSLVVLNAAGQVSQTYDKHHLVPFGEFMPAEWLFRHINVGGFAQRAEGGYESGPGPKLLDFGPLGAALPLICYEAVFAHDVGGAPARPAFLMQITNDAWFGARSGPQQHLAQARMRAIEQGLPMVRAANTGISAVIDPKGRVTSALALNTAGYLDAALPAPGDITIYARSGDLPIFLVLCAALGLLLARRLRRLRGDGIDVFSSGA